MPCCGRDSNGQILNKDSNEDERGRNMENNGPKNTSNYAKCQNSEKEESNNAIENSTRFSIRVMEAMRSLQRRNNDRSLTSSSIKEIAEYIKTNYNFDGDLDAQVQTALSRIWRQGFTMKIGKENYVLMGPFATCLNSVQDFLASKSSRKRKCKSRSRSRCSSKKRKKEKKSKKKRKNKNTRKIIRDCRSRGSAKNNDVKKCQNRGILKGRSKSSSRKNAPESSRNPSKHRKQQFKNSKNRNDSAEKLECACGRIHDNNQDNEDFQSGNSPTTFVTCEELNSGRLTAGNTILNKNLSRRNELNTISPEIDENSTNSEEGSSSDSVYRELKSKKINDLSFNNKDLKKWIKHCRDKNPRK